jgi:competence protein ComFC
MNNRTIRYFQDLIIKIFDWTVNIILPKEEKVQALEALGSAGLFEKIPRSENFDFTTDKIKAVFNYKTSLCRQAIWEIKYRANKKLIRDFSLLLYEFILEELTDLETFNNFRNIILIPVPSSRERQREKGFNQCVLITQELIKIDRERLGNNFTLAENLLIKEVDTLHQSHVSNRKTRLKNVMNTFSAKTGTREMSDYSFIIIDDVITTGATMNEAFRAITSTGIKKEKIRGYALAH